MKIGKAAGEDGVTTEMLKALDDTGLKELTKLCNLIYESGKIPEDLLKSVFVTLLKKPKATKCNEYRTISLMSHVAKLLLRIIMERIKNKIEDEISDNQNGFRKGKGTREGIFNMRTIGERYLEKQKAFTFASLTTKRHSIELTCMQQW